MTTEVGDLENTVAPPFQHRRSGSMIQLKDVRLCGVSAETAGAEQEQVKVFTRLALSSEQSLFFKVVEGLVSSLTPLVEAAGQDIKLDAANTLLLIIRENNDADLWVDSVDLAIRCMIKRDVRAGEAVREGDIADVTSLKILGPEISPKDGVLFLFRHGWRFALFFDFNPNRNLDLELMEQTLGALFRKVAFANVYDAVANESTFARLVSLGWFPFIEIIGHEFHALQESSASEHDLAVTEGELIRSFDSGRLERMLRRWSAKPHFASRAPILRAAIRAFGSNEPIACIKIVLTEIEGILAEAHRAAHGHSAKLKSLIEFAAASALHKAGGVETLLLPNAFVRYLQDVAFANFDPDGPPVRASSRHAVGHGAADPESYTQVRALQALLTLDQFAFYT